MLSRVFTTDDTTLYSAWEGTDEGPAVVLFVPGVGEIRMTLAKAEDVSAELARQAEFGRWAAMEENHDKAKGL